MKAVKLAGSISLVLGSAVLGGCYIVPIDGHYPPVPLPSAPAPLPSAPAPLPSAPAPLQVRLYPLNETAGKVGALSAVVTDNANGHGTFTLNYAGEVLQGEASRLPGGQRGIASASGARGTYVNCEYALSGTSRGTGACTFSNGAKYQLHFGG